MFIFIVGRLLDIHGETGGSSVAAVGESGLKIDRPDNYEPPVLESV